MTGSTTAPSASRTSTTSPARPPTRATASSVPARPMTTIPTFLKAGSAGDYAKAYGLDAYPWWQKVSEHPAYDVLLVRNRRWTSDHGPAAPDACRPCWWSRPVGPGGQLGARCTATPPSSPRTPPTTRTTWCMGPWRHSQVNYDACNLGASSGTATPPCSSARRACKPFLNQLPEDGAPDADTPPVLIYDPGHNSLGSLQVLAGGRDQRPVPRTPTAAWPSAPAAAKGAAAHDEYVSDPAKPVPYMPRPMQFGDRSRWTPWLVTDQRSVADRPDVLSYVTEPLTAPLKIAGVPKVNLTASTSRHGQRLGGQADRRLPRRGPQPARTGRLPAGRGHGHLPRPLSRELQRSQGDQAEHAH